MIRSEYVEFLAVVGVDLTANTLYFSAEEACANIRFLIDMGLATEQSGRPL